MIKLNDDYKIIADKIKELEEHFINCKTPADCANYVRTYQVLIMIYASHCYTFPHNKKCKKNVYLRNTNAIASHIIDKKRMNDLISNKGLHSNLIANFYLDCFTLFKDYVNNNWDRYYKNAKISAKEQEEILDDFLLTDGKDLQEVYLKHRKENKLFLMSEEFCDLLNGTTGVTVWTPDDGTNFVLLAEQDNKIGELVTAIHELGHVYDFTTYANSHTLRDTAAYSNNSPYCEVASIYHQYKFYEYLLKNNIYPNDTMKNFLSSVNSNLTYLGEIFPLKLISDEYLRKKKLIIEKQEINRVLNDLNEKEELIDYNIVKDTFDAYDSIRYGYGFMLTMNMLENPDLYDNFQRIREPLFDKEKLDNAGFTDKVINKSMVKRMNKYFGETK